MAQAKDINRLLDLEYECFPHPMGKEWFEQALKHYVTVVAYNGPKLVGYIVYFVKDNQAEILSIAVDKMFQRSGLGTKLLNIVFNHAPSSISFYISEANLVAQMWAKKNGFICKRIDNEFYDIPGEETAYFFERELLCLAAT